jgi:tmRNA-binding protein
MMSNQILRWIQATHQEGLQLVFIALVLNLNFVLVNLWLKK